MKVTRYDFGTIVIDGKEYNKDIIIDMGKIRKRDKKASKSLKARYGHTPLSINEDIPWDCKRLIIGRGMSSLLPVMDEVKKEAGKKGVELVLLPTSKAIKHLNDNETNFILHLTC